MPYDVPVENAIGVAQAVYETDSVREMLKNYVAEDEDIEVELPDYEHLEKPTGRGIYSGFCDMCGMYLHDGRSK